MIFPFYQMMYLAQAKSKIYLEEEIEAYVVRMLDENSLKTDIADAILTLELLQAATTEEYREVGDKSLIYSGFYHKRGIDYIPIGQSAYNSAADLSGKEIYEKLSIYTPKIITLLQQLNTLH